MDTNEKKFKKLETPWEGTKFLCLGVLSLYFSFSMLVHKRRQFLEDTSNSDSLSQKDGNLVLPVLSVVIFSLHSFYSWLALKLYLRNN